MVDIADGIGMVSKVWINQQWSDTFIFSLTGHWGSGVLAWSRPILPVWVSPSWPSCSCLCSSTGTVSYKKLLRLKIFSRTLCRSRILANLRCFVRRASATHMTQPELRILTSTWKWSQVNLKVDVQKVVFQYLVLSACTALGQFGQLAPDIRRWLTMSKSAHMGPKCKTVLKRWPEVPNMANWPGGIRDSGNMCLQIKHVRFFEKRSFSQSRGPPKKVGGHIFM